MKAKKNFILAAVMMFALTGCYPTGEKPRSDADGTDNSKLSEQISSIVSENEHLTVDITPTENTPTELPKLDVSVMEWDTQKIDEVFLQQYDNLEHSEYPCDFFTNENYHLYDGTDEKAYRLVYEPGRLSSSERERFGVYGYGTMASALGTYCFSEFFDDDEIDLFPKSEAIARVKEQLASLGITNLSEPSIYPITADKANEYFAAMDYDEYEKWTNDDEIYILRFPIEYNGIPVTTDASFDMVAGGHGSYFIGSHITAIVSKDKILSLECEDLFSPKYSVGETVSIRCSAQEALKTATEHYNNITLGDSDIALENPELVYVPFEQHDEKNFTLVPMWKIDASFRKADEKLMGKCSFLFIEVENGNIVIW